MESILTALVSASAIRSNVAAIRRLLRPGTQVCIVVKADCYGHGLKALLDVLSREADCLAVATPNEAITLRDAGYRGPVILLLPASSCRTDEDLGELIRKGVTLTLVNRKEVEAVSKAASQVGKPALVHVKMDSGMGRSGALPEEVLGLMDSAQQETAVELKGLYTHFATAEWLDQSYALWQLQRFLDVADRHRLRNGLLLHAANSAATLALPSSHLDMVRPGLAVYGYLPMDRSENEIVLKPCLRLVSRLVEVRMLPEGSRCGYGCTHTFTRYSRVGLAPVGYADGYFRSLSNASLMRVRDVLVRTCGMVSMDQVVLDLTDVPAAEVGDEVEVISSDPRDPHSVESLARLAGIIPYEVTCRLGARVRRILVD